MLTLVCVLVLSINVTYHHKVNLKEGLLTVKPPCKSQKFLFWIHQMGELLFLLYFLYKKHCKETIMFLTIYCQIPF